MSVIIQVGILSVIILIVLLGFFRSEYEKNALIVKEYEIADSKIKEAKTFVFLSDLHEHDFGDGNKRLLEEVYKVKPDAVLIGGDFIICKKNTHTKISRQICKDLSERFPIYYANGNHEERMKGDFDKGKKKEIERLCGSNSICETVGQKEYDEYIRYLKDIGVNYLDDNSMCLGDIWIHGLNIEYKYYRKFIVPKMKKDYITSRIGAKKEVDKYHILLAHSPMFTKTYEEWGADLVLSGHFHGGTIRFPFGIGLMTPQFQLFSNRVVGLRRYKDVSHIISAGLGTHSVNIRINDKPELIVVRLIPK